MIGNVAITVPLAPRPPLFQVGRSFVHPLFDLAVIGGLLTLPIALWAAFGGGSAAVFLGLTFPVIALLCNQAHFAASTVRLYTKPGAFEDYPVLTLVFPLLTLFLTSVFVVFASGLGQHIQALYLTWSPYHYAAQTFGLATMYAYRSGCALDRREWWTLRAACMLPFAHSLLSGAPLGSGLGWLFSYRTLVSDPTTFTALTAAFNLTLWGSLAAPLLVFGVIAYRSWARDGDDGEAPRAGLPLLSIVLMLSNAVWWTLFSFWDAQIWATVLHGLQYLGILTIFHSNDAVRQPGNRHGRGYHVAVMLVLCIALGYGLFQCWPRAYMWAGYGQVESMFMVVAVINIHHFIVDRYIWRIRKDRNYQTVVA